MNFEHLFLKQNPTLLQKTLGSPPGSPPGSLPGSPPGPTQDPAWEMAATLGLGPRFLRSAQGPLRAARGCRVRRRGTGTRRREALLLHGGSGGG